MVSVYENFFSSIFCIMAFLSYILCIQGVGFWVGFGWKTYRVCVCWIYHKKSADFCVCTVFNTFNDLPDIRNDFHGNCDRK